MPSSAQLHQLLERIDGRGYPAYRDLRGRWSFDGFDVIVDHIQGDPFAALSRVRLVLDPGLSDAINLAEKTVRLAVEDWLLRRFCRAIMGRRRGSGRSGEISCLQPGPEVEERSAVRILSGGLAEFRFRVGMPARGRRILGRAAWSMFDEDIRHAAGAFANKQGLLEHVANTIRQRQLRSQLSSQGLVAFIENGSLLPRASGVDESPLPGGVPFQSPPSLEVELQAAGKPVRGMGIPPGVTVIVGGGFHGKSTLLGAIQVGHLDHIAGDGREGVVAVPDGVKVKAEDGRNVAGVDISAFLSKLPGNRCTRPFSTEDASGSTSQAAAIVEAVEAGATLLLLDEDTSATNLLVRDQRMRKLIDQKDEPITPFVERARQLSQDAGISTIIVIGGVADYLGVADRVVAMIDFHAHDYTEKAKQVGVARPVAPNEWHPPKTRTIVSETIRADKISARDNRAIRFGRSEIALQAVEQVRTADHAWSVGQAIRTMGYHAPEQVDIPTILDELEALMDERTVDALSPRKEPVGELIRPRRHEVAAAVNRLRSLRLKDPDNC